MTTLRRIVVYPVKSLDGISVDACDVLESGALAWDRRFAIVDAMGQMITAKRTPAIHRVRATFDLAERTVTLSCAADASTAAASVQPGCLFALDGPHVALGEWLSNVFGQRCTLVENDSQGFPDDPEALGPTLVSTATLREVAVWFGGLPLDDARRRFRANLEVDAGEPFWEDRLVSGSTRRPVRFQVGPVEFFGQKPCQRCVVPSRSPDSGELIPRFAQVFCERREETLPEFAPRERFDHFFRLAINTSLASPGDLPRLAVGDAVRVLS